MDSTTQSVVNKVKCLLKLADPQSNTKDFLPNEIKCCLVQINSTFSAFNIFYLQTIEDLISNIAYGELHQDFDNLPDRANIRFFLSQTQSFNYIKRVFIEVPQQKISFNELERLIDKYYSPIELTKLMN